MTVNGQMGDSIIDHNIENIDSCAHPSKTYGTIVKCVDDSVADRESTNEIISKCNQKSEISSFETSVIGEKSISELTSMVARNKDNLRFLTEYGKLTKTAKMSSQKIFRC